MLPTEALKELRLAQGRKATQRSTNLFNVTGEDNMPCRFVIECTLENKVSEDAFIGDLVILVESRLGRYMSPDFDHSDLTFEFEYDNKKASCADSLRLNKFLDLMNLNK
jgi:hypothetical protein